MFRLFVRGYLARLIGRNFSSHLYWSIACSSRRIGCKFKGSGLVDKLVYQWEWLFHHIIGLQSESFLQQQQVLPVNLFRVHNCLSWCSRKLRARSQFHTSLIRYRWMDGCFSKYQLLCEIIQFQIVGNTYNLAIAVLILSMKNYLPTQPPLLLR